MTRSNRALLIVPPTGRYIRESRCQTPIDDLKTVALRTPVDLLYAAACFERGGCDCRVVDYPAEGQGWDALEALLTEWRPDFLVLEITTPTLRDDLRAAELARQVNPATVTIAQGAHFNIFDRQTLAECPSLDITLRGEFEGACEELARGTDRSAIAGLTWRDDQGVIHRNPDRPFESNLDAFPFPARHLARNGLYIRPDTGEAQTTIVTNRGCPHRCVFCLAGQVAGGRNRYRSVENVVAEARECVERHGIRNFLFRSDLFTQDRQWVIALCQAILDAGLSIRWAANSRVDSLDAEMLDWMRRAGCWIMAFGVESGVDAHLGLMGKRTTAEQSVQAIRMTREAGILTSVYMLLGLPWDTEASVAENIRFFRRLDADFTEVFYVYPFPGTALYYLAVEKGLLAPGAIPAAAYAAPAMPTEALSLERLAQLRGVVLRRMYLRPRYIARTLWRAARQGALRNYLRYGWLTVTDLLRKPRRG